MTIASGPTSPLNATPKPSFAFFNRAGGSLWRHSRALHQEWADRLREREYADVRAALRSDDAQARSAFLELYLHECLVRGGHEVVIHPELKHTPRRPDFLASWDATRVFIEAIAPGTSLADRAAANRMGALLFHARPGRRRQLRPHDDLDYRSQ